jgi:hypothetical protein
MLDRLFKNREIRIRVARSDSLEETTEAPVTLFDDPDAFKNAAQDVVKYAAFAISGILVLGAVLHTISELIIKNADSNEDDE